MKPPARAAFVVVSAVGLSLGLSLGGGAARANGAFPDSLALLLPEGRPDEIVLATNFGLLVTRDGARSWGWICEPAVGPGTISLYQQAPGPGGPIVAVGSAGLYTSRDGCDWVTGGGSLDGRSGVVDAFVDPNDAGGPGGARHVLAIAYLPRDSGLDSGLVESRDGGRTFGEPLFTAPPGHYLSSVEIPRGAPERIYAAFYRSRDLHPFLARSSDGGRSFETIDHGALGQATLRIAAVSSADPLTLYVRQSGPAVDTLLVSRDGGATFRTALSPAERLTTFLRRADGTLLTATRDGRAFRSRDDGGSFSPWAAGLHLRALAERGGLLYAAADDLADPFAVGVSEDGETFRALFHYRDVCGYLACAHVASECAPRWSVQAALIGATGDGVCGRDGGAGAGDGGPSDGGCGCALGRRERAGGVAWSAALLLLAVGGRRRGRHDSAPPGAYNGGPCPRNW